MKLNYTDPEMEIRIYSVSPEESILTTSGNPEPSTNPPIDLGDGDDHDLFG